MSKNFFDTYKHENYIRDKYALAYLKECGKFPATYAQEDFVCEFKPKVDGPFGNVNIDYVVKSAFVSTPEEYMDIVRHRVEMFENSTVFERITGEKKLMDWLFGSTKESKDTSLIIILISVGVLMIIKSC